VSGDGELVEREQRQLDLMRQRLVGFVAGEYAIDRVIADLEGLLEALQTASEDWVQEFRQSWGELEIHYAAALDQGDAVPDAKTPPLGTAVGRMLKLVDERMAEVRGTSQTPDEIALDPSKSTEERIRALQSLWVLDRPLTKTVLLAIASRENETVDLLEYAGQELARIDHEGVRVTQFDLRDMNPVAYEANFDWMPP